MKYYFFLLRAAEVGLMDNLLISSQPPTGKIKFSEWLETNKKTLGRVYASELAKHFK
jgi:hypothetical protein